MERKGGVEQAYRSHQGGQGSLQRCLFLFPQNPELAPAAILVLMRVRGRVDVW